MMNDLQGSRNVGFWRRMWQRVFARQRPIKPLQKRRSIPRLECLEDRLTPATGGLLSLSGTTLTLTGLTISGGNTFNVSTSGGHLIISDAAAGATILSTVSGFTGSGTSSVSGAIPATVTAFSIQGVASADTVNIAALSLTDALTVSAKTINISNPITATAVTINDTAGTTTIKSAATTITATAGGLTFNTPIALNTNEILSATNGNIALNGALSASNDSLTIIDNGGSVTTAGAITGLTGLSIPTAQNITLGPVSVNGTVSLIASNSVTLNGALDETGVSSIIVRANTSGGSSGNFTQNAAGNIIGTAAVVSITVNNGSTGTGSAIIQDITTGSGGSVTINTQAGASGGAIIDANGAGNNINSGSTGSLTVSAGPGGVNLDTDTGTVNANTQGMSGLGQIAIRNTSSAALMVTTAGTANGPITITNNSDIDVNGKVSAGGTKQNIVLTTTASGNVVFGTAGFVQTATGNVAVTASGDITHGNATDDISAQSVNLSAGAGIGSEGSPIQLSTAALTATNTGGDDDIALATDDNAGYGPTTATINNSGNPGNIFLNQTGGQTLTVSATTANGTINVNNDSANLIASSITSGGSGGDIMLSTTTSGDVMIGSVNGSTGANKPVVTINSVGAINQVAGGTGITAPSVSLGAATGIGTAGALIVTSADVTKIGTTAGPIDVALKSNATTGPVTVENVTDSNGGGNVLIAQTGGQSLTTESESFANVPVITFTNTGADLNILAPTISVGTLNVETIGSGDINITGGTLSSETTGTINFISAGAISQTSGADAASSGTVNLTAAGNIEANVIAPTLNVTSTGGFIDVGNAPASASTVTLKDSSPSSEVEFTQSGGQAATVSVTAQGLVDVTNIGADLDVTSITTTSDGVEVGTTTSGDVNLGSISAPGQVVNVDSAGEITGSGTNAPATVNVTAASVSFLATAGIGTSAANGVNVLAPTIDATDVGAGIWINSLLAGGSANPVDFDSVVENGSGSVFLTANSDATVGDSGPVSANAGSISITDTGGDITFNNSVSSNSGSVTITGSGNISLPAADSITGPTGVTISGGTGGLSGTIDLEGNISSSAAGGSITVNGGLSVFNTITLAGTDNGGTGITINGGNAGNDINVTGNVIIFQNTPGDFVINGGNGADDITFDLNSGFNAIAGSVEINGPSSGNAIFNITDPAAGVISAPDTFTIDFGAGHTGSDLLNITPQVADTVVVSPTSVIFTGGAGFTPWVLDNFIVGQDQTSVL